MESAACLEALGVELDSDIVTFTYAELRQIKASRQEMASPTGHLQGQVEQDATAQICTQNKQAVSSSMLLHCTCS